MREFKFRIWHPELKKIDYDPKYYGDNWGDSLNELLAIFNRCRFLMQYTGLEDKNGKEIYEGDIVKYKYITGFSAEEDYKEGSDDVGYDGERIQEVKFEEGEFYPRPQFYEEGDTYYSWRHWDFEIIGNIYENAELLEEQDRRKK